MLVSGRKKSRVRHRHITTFQGLNMQEHITIQKKITKRARAESRAGVRTVQQTPLAQSYKESLSKAENVEGKTLTSKRQGLERLVHGSPAPRTAGTVSAWGQVPARYRNGHGLGGPSTRGRGETICICDWQIHKNGNWAILRGTRAVFLLRPTDHQYQGLCFALDHLRSQAMHFSLSIYFGQLKAKGGEKSLLKGKLLKS